MGPYLIFFRLEENGALSYGCKVYDMGCNMMKI